MTRIAIISTALLLLASIAVAQSDQTAAEPIALEDVLLAEPMVTLNVNPHDPDKEAWEHTATVTNHGELPISFAAYMPYAETLSTTIGWETRGAEAGWQAAPLGFCGTGLGSYTLEPGQSVEIYVPRISAPGEHRYNLHVQQDGLPTSHPIVSEAFVVEAALPGLELPSIE